MIKLALRWSKWISAGVVTLVIVLVLAIAGLLFTNTGLNFALWTAQKFVPQLAVETTQGALFPRFTLNNVRFSDPTLHIDAQLKAATIAINANCFLEPSVCINDINISGLKFEMPTLPDVGEQVDEQTSEPLTTVSTPVPIRVNRLTLNDIQLDVLGNNIAWKHFSTQASFQGNNLIVGKTLWQHIDVSLANPAQGVEPAVSPNTTEPTPIKLPDILIPLRINLSRFDVENFTLKQDYPVVIHHLGLQAKAYRHDVSIQTLELDMPEVDAHLKANAKLSGEYPLSLDLTSKIKQADAKGQALSLQVSGSVAKLSLQAELSELAHAKITAKLQPLEPQLPFELEIDSLIAQWPLVGQGDYFVDAPQAFIRGSLEHYSLGLTGQLKGKELPDVAIETKGEGDLNEVALSQLQVDTLGGQVAGEMKANWQAPINWYAKLNVSQLQPGLQWQQAEGVISGDIETSGELTQQGGWKVRVPNLALDGVVRDYPLHVQGQVEASDVTGKGQYQIATQGINLSHGPNTVTAKGELDKEWHMLLSLDLPDLAKTVPDVKGKVIGDILLRGKMATPQIKLVLDADSLAWQQEATVKHVTIAGNVTPLPVPKADIKMTLKDAKYQDQVISSLVLDANGDQSDHNITLDVDSELVSTSLNIQGALNDSPSLMWHGRINRMRVESEQGAWTLNQMTKADVDVAKKNATIDAHCWNQAGSSVCLDKPSTVGENGEVQLSINKFEFAQIKRFLPPEIHLKGAANAEVWAKWQANVPPQAKVELSLSSGELIQDLEQPIQIGWDKVAVQASLIRNRLQANWLVDVTDNGDLSGKVVIPDVTLVNKSMDGEVKLSEFNLDFLAPLIGEYSSVKSTIATDIKFKGPMLHPSLNGALTVNGIEVKGDISPVEVDSGNVVINFNGYQAEMNSTIVTQDGDLKVTGDADWKDLGDWRVNSHVFAESLLVDLPPMVKVKVVPDLSLEMQPKVAKVTGNISLPWGRIVVEELPPSAVGVSKDQVVLDENLIPISEQNTLPFNIETDVTISIGDDFKLSAFGLEGGLVGRMNVTQKDKGPLVNGEVNIQDGQYRAFGQDLIIKEGKVLMNGPVDQPYLSIRAIRNPENTQDDVVAGVQVTGPADEPVVTIFSDPTMPQANALSYLLRGQDIDSETGSGGNAMTTALIGLSLARSGKVVGEIGSVFGVQDLQLDTAGSGDDSQVTVSGYILPGLQVKYGVGIFNSVGEFTVRYRLMTDLYVEAVSGLDSAVDLLYQFQLD